MGKKVVILVFLGIFSLTIVSSGFAGTVGNPASTDIPRGTGVFSLKQDRNLSFRGAFDTEFLFDRDLTGSASSNLELMSGEWYMGRISYSFYDRFEPYIKLGVAHLKAKWTESGNEAKLESDTGFAWGLGAKVLIYEFEQPRIKIISDGFYRIADLDAEEGYYGGAKNTLDTSKSRFLVREWQIALLAATEIDITGPGKDQVLGVSRLVPYAGMKYSDISGRIRQELTNGSLYNPGKIEADNNVGIFVGCDFVGENSVLLNLEGRFIDETAMTAGLAVLF